MTSVQSDILKEFFLQMRVKASASCDPVAFATTLRLTYAVPDGEGVYDASAYKNPLDILSGKNNALVSQKERKGLKFDDLDLELPLMAERGDLIKLAEHFKSKRHDASEDKQTKFSVGLRLGEDSNVSAAQRF